MAFFFLSYQTINPFISVEVQFQYDANFYRRFFAEIFLYLSKTDLQRDWRGVVIYPQRQVESEYQQNFSELLNSSRVERIYLEELSTQSTTSVGISTIKLIAAETNQAIEIAKPLIEKINEQVTEENTRRELLELIESILIYKLPQAKREEIEVMFSLSDLKQTRFYQEAKEEGRELGREEGIQTGKELGREEGIQTGREEGIQTGKELGREEGIQTGREEGIQTGKELGREEGIQTGRELGRQQVKLESIPKLLQLGLSVDIIAQSLDLSRETVEAEAQKYQPDSEN